LRVTRYSFSVSWQRLELPCKLCDSRERACIIEGDCACGRSFAVSSDGKGSKDVFVGTHARWKNGKRRIVEAHLRSGTPRMSLRSSAEQLAFDFPDPNSEPPATNKAS
jgi:hypothetical protein